MILCNAKFYFTANYEENESRGWYCALLSATAIQYIAAITGIALLYTYYNCGVNIALITLNLILCLIVSVLSIMPQVQERISRSGLLQSSVVTLYVVYLTWSALANNPNEKCHSEIFPSGDNNKVNQFVHLIPSNRGKILYWTYSVNFLLSCSSSSLK